MDQNSATLWIGASILLSLNLHRTVAVGGWGLTNCHKSHILNRLLRELPNKEGVKQIFLIVSGNDMFKGRIVRHKDVVHYHFREEKTDIDTLANHYYDFVSYLLVAFPNAKIDLLPPLPRRLVGQPCCITYQGNSRIIRYMKAIKKKCEPELSNVNIYFWHQVLKFIGLTTSQTSINHINSLFSTFSGDDGVHLREEGKLYFKNLYLNYANRKGNLQ